MFDDLFIKSGTINPHRESSQTSFKKGTCFQAYD